MPPILDEVSHGGADLLVAGRRQMPSHAVPSLAGEIKQRVDKLALLVGGNLLRAEGFFGRPRQNFFSGKTGMAIRAKMAKNQESYFDKKQN